MKKNPMEEMWMPCPHDMCDGSGIIPGYEDGDDQECLCVTDEELDEIY